MTYGIMRRLKNFFWRHTTALSPETSVDLLNKGSLVLNFDDLYLWIDFDIIKILGNSKKMPS